MITLDAFVGNDDLRKLLKISIIASKAINEALPHILLKGPAGTGKTTLAEAIAREFGTQVIALTPNTAKKPPELRKFFLRLPGEGYGPDGNIIGDLQPQIVFIDEIHQLSLVAQELLGIAMQDWKLPVTIKGVDTFEWVPRFTLIGATTLPGKLSKPFFDRFKIQADFETYSLDETCKIVELHSQKLGISLQEGVTLAIAKRSRGIARLVTRFLDRLRDAAIVSAQNTGSDQKTVTLELAQFVFNTFLKIDDRGLTKTDIKILKQLYQAEEPAGIELLVAVSNEDKLTIEASIEPYLLQEGLIERTKRGRIITEEGKRYLVFQGYVAQGLARKPRVLTTIT